MVGSSPLRVLERVPAELGGERAILRQRVTALRQISLLAVRDSSHIIAVQNIKNKLKKSGHGRDYFHRQQALYEHHDTNTTPNALNPHTCDTPPQPLVQQDSIRRRNLAIMSATTRAKTKRSLSTDPTRTNISSELRNFFPHSSTNTAHR